MKKKEYTFVINNVKNKNIKTKGVLFMQEQLKQLEKIIQGNFELKSRHRARLLALIITSIIKARTVNLADIATVFLTGSKIESNYRRIQRFFKDFTMSYLSFGKMMLNLLPKDKTFIIAIDRTNWKFGKKDINILMLTLVYKGISFPICWKLLNKGGNSNYKERIELMEKLLEILPKERIKSLVADREFDGEDWVEYLVDKSINFHIRIKNTITYNGHRKEGGKRIKKLLDKQRTYNYIIYPEKVVIFKQMLHIGGKRLPNKDYLIIISNANPQEALEDYKQRWSIEKLFNKLKTRGFNLEDTQMTALYKLEKLIGLVSIAFIWSFLAGELLIQTYRIKMITNPKNPKRVKSIFDQGFKYLRKIICNIYETINEFNNLVNLLSCA